MKERFMCRLPWTGFSNDPSGVVRPCCIYKEPIKAADGVTNLYIQETPIQDILNGPYMRGLREAFRNGEKPRGCETCWVDEANGKQSKRQLYLSEIDWESEPEWPSEYQLIISNTCNLKCRSCSPSHSTKWHQEALQRGLWFERFQKPAMTDEEHSVFWKDRNQWMAHVRDLEIVGGEPFYIKHWRQLWKEFVDQGLSKDITLGISSNGTIFDKECVEFLVENFRYTGIGLSIDGIGAQFEYLRHPGKWNEVEDNINSYYQIYERENRSGGFRVGGERYRNFITHTISWPNLWYVPTFHAHAYKHWPKMKIWNNVVYGPAYLSPWVLPGIVKAKITERINAFAFADEYTADIHGIVNMMNSRPYDEELFMKGIAELKAGDEYRRENFATSFPEFFELIEPWWNRA